MLVDYWAEWCGPCKMIAPILEAIAAEHGDKLDIVKLNVDDNPARSPRSTGSSNIPTLGVFSGGEVVRELVGARSKSALLRELADFLLKPLTRSCRGQPLRPLRPRQLLSGREHTRIEPRQQFGAYLGSPCEARRQAAG